MKTKLNRINDNCHELELSDGERVLFSYGYPVAMWDGKSYHRILSVRGSKTTSIHINRWVNKEKMGTDLDSIDLVASYSDWRKEV